MRVILRRSSVAGLCAASLEIDSSFISSILLIFGIMRIIGQVDHITNQHMFTNCRATPGGVSFVAPKHTGGLRP
jgi:hypothetical protein